MTHTDRIVPDGSNSAPYYDDYDETKGFHRVMFRPGRAVQARELTQLQTILQKQIARFGDGIYKNGSMVTGGQITFQGTNELIGYANLYSTYFGNTVSAERFIYSTVNTSSNGVATVIGYDELTTEEPATLILRYHT